ncbi:MAG TPA: hypothetical protein VIF08_02005 [Candidatus Limnocylindrales bacterium]
MLQQLTVTLRRRAAAFMNQGHDGGQNTDSALAHPVLVRQAEIDSLRGVTPAAADVSECTCPEPCERDHANE